MGAEQSELVCPKCRALSRVSTKFCRGCGYRFAESDGRVEKAGAETRQPPPAPANPWDAAKKATQRASQAVDQVGRLAVAVKAPLVPRWTVVVGEALPSPAQILAAKAGEIIRTQATKATEAAAERVVRAVTQPKAPATPPAPPPTAAPAGQACPSCGRAMKPGARFCGGCGRSVNGSKTGGGA